MSFPTTEYDSFEEKVNQHEDTPASEAHTIPATTPFNVELDELPAVDSVTVSGFTEVAYIPTSTDTFYVNYASAVLYFHSSNAGESITVAYTSQGSVLRDSDINDLQDAVNTLQREFYAILHAPIASCRLTETTPNSTSLILRAGAYYVTPRIPVIITQQTINLASGEFVVSAMTPNYSRVLVFTLDASGDVAMYEGTEAALEENAVFTFSSAWAAAHGSEILVASVVVTDNGSGGAGTILAVAQSKINDLRGGASGLLADGSNYAVDGTWLRLRDTALDEWAGVALHNGVLSTFSLTTTTTTTGEVTTTTTTTGKA